MDESLYSMRLKLSAQKEIEALPYDVANRLWPRIKKLASDPRPTGCVKLKGYERLRRIRCGNYRVIYEIDDATRTIMVIAVRHRRNAYG